MLASLFKPYLPTLSKSIFEYFGDIDDEMVKDLYMGEFDSFKNYVCGGVHLVKKPKGLVQKIDHDRIEELKADLLN